MVRYMFAPKSNFLVFLPFLNKIFLSLTLTFKERSSVKFDETRNLYVKSLVPGLRIKELLP